MMLWARVELKEMTEEGKFESYFKDRLGQTQLGNTHEAKRNQGMTPVFLV